MNTAAVLEAQWRFFPFAHQLREFEMRCDAEAVALGWTMRTGKTKAMIDKACHLYGRGKIDGMLIFAPNGVHEQWVEVEWPKHGWPNVPYNGLTWKTSVAGAKGGNQLRGAKREAWAAEQARWWDKFKRSMRDPAMMVLAINSETMTRKDVRRVVARFLKNRRVFGVFDESDDFGIPGAARTKMARALARRCLYRAILSGTLSDASPLAMFTQYELLEKGALGFTDFAEFKERYAVTEERTLRNGRRFPTVTGFQNLEELRERAARFTSVVLRDEVKDMPAIAPRERIIAPSEEQLAAFRQLHNSWLINIDDEEVDVGERALRLRKMQQIFGGFVKDAHGRTKRIPGPNPRVEAMLEEVHRAPGKVVIWCAYHEDMDLVKSNLDACKIDSVGYHGRVSDEEKANGLHRFRNERGIKALIGHVRSCGRGRDFSEASTILWYSYDFAARLRRQGMERATKIGGGTIQSVDFIAGTGKTGRGPDRYILDVIERRIDVADFLTGVGMRELLEGVRV
jgi:hypothetical protein